MSLRKLFWSILTISMFPLIAWALQSRKPAMVYFFSACALIFLALISLKRPREESPEEDDADFLRFPFRLAAKFPDFWKEIKVGFGGAAAVAMIYWSTFVDWNKWGPAVAQLSIVGIVASSLAWMGLSDRLETYKHKHLLFWTAWIAASLVLGLVINRLLYLLPLVYLLFSGNWGKENEKINSYQ